MSILEIWLLAVSLAIDCFTVSITSGIILHRIRWGIFLKMAFLFGLFQAAMPFLGWLGASRFNHLIETYDHWIAFALLAFLGIRMIREHFKDEEERSFDPTRMKVILTLAVATSIDRRNFFCLHRLPHIVLPPLSADSYRNCLIRNFSGRKSDRSIFRETLQPAR